MYVPAGAEMSTSEVVEVLKNPGGGLVVPQPSSFPFLPVAIGAGVVALLVYRGKKQ